MDNPEPDPAQFNLARIPQGPDNLEPHEDEDEDIASLLQNGEEGEDVDTLLQSEEKSFS